MNLRPMDHQAVLHPQQEESRKNPKSFYQAIVPCSLRRCLILDGIEVRYHLATAATRGSRGRSSGNGIRGLVMGQNDDYQVPDNGHNRNRGHDRGQFRSPILLDLDGVNHVLDFGAVLIKVFNRL